MKTSSPSRADSWPALLAIAVAAEGPRAVRTSITCAHGTPRAARGPDQAGAPHGPQTGRASQGSPPSRSVPASRVAVRV